jgi:recombination protein RecR
MHSLEPFTTLISKLARLPGVGRRSAERMAFRIATDRKGMGRELAQALRDVDEQIVACTRCGNLTLRTQDPCAICDDPRRDSRLLCVVEDPQGIQQIEAAGGFRGLYYCLMGKISPMQGTDIPPPKIEALINRITAGQVEEVILAFDSDVESDATTSFLHHRLARTGITVTRLAFGIPAGSGIAYADPVTLARALNGRQTF